MDKLKSTKIEKNLIQKNKKNRGKKIKKGANNKKREISKNN